jgi:hypothetical protein
MGLIQGISLLQSYRQRINGHFADDSYLIIHLVVDIVKDTVNTIQVFGDAFGANIQ